MRDGGIAGPACTEAAVGALWALADGSTHNKASIIKLGALDAIVHLTMNGATDCTAANAASTLSVLAERAADSGAAVAKKLTTNLAKSKLTPTAAARLLASITLLCGPYARTHSQAHM